MNKLLIYILLAFFSVVSYSQKAKKIQFVGGARSLVSHSNLYSDGDTVTSPRSTGGYAFLDLGIKINPNEKTEILGMFRINNAFGGFWGGGVSFDVRQLYVRGVACDVIRYQIGNIDYKLTPYTFFNHNPDFLTNSVGIQVIKEGIVDYETFYKNNSWRQQGASVNFALNFPKIIKEIDFNGFISRLNPTDFNNVLERLYGGGNMIIKQGKHASLGINHVSVFDLPGTAVDSNIYSNNVSTITYDFNFKKKNIIFGLDGESGISSLSQSLFEDERLEDYFVHARAYMEFKKQNFKVSIGFMDNGADFRSFGAQSKRVNFNQENSFYNRYTNEQIIRPISVYDLYNDPTLSQEGITVGVMDVNPTINNALPYGIATFNRRGLYLSTNHSSKKDIITSSAKIYNLSEIRGQGTTNLKRFTLVNINSQLNAHKLWGLKKEFNFQVGLSYQKSNRKGEFSFETVDLQSTQISFGVEKEIAEQLFLMGNLFLLDSKGNDQIPIRNQDDQIINYEEFNVNGREFNVAAGLKFNFSNEAFLAAFYELNNNQFVTNSNYTFSQTSIVYVLKF